MKTRRILGLVLTGVLALSLLAGCSGKNNETANTNKATSNEAVEEMSTEPVTFSMFYGMLNGTQFGWDNDQAKYVTEKTGVTIDMDYVVGDLPTKVGVMIASGDYPDFIWGHDQHNKFIEAGAAIPLNDLIDKYGKNIKKVYGPLLNKIKSEDGNIYFLPPYREDVDNSKANRGFYVQRRVLEEAGYPELTTLDEYFALLSDYAKKHPETEGKETIAFSFITDSWRFFTLTNAPSDLRGFTNDGFCQFDPATLEGKAYTANEDSKKYWEALNKLYLEGLLDPEAFTMNYDQYIEKVTTGRVLGFYDQWWQMLPAQNSLAEQGKDEYVYVGMPLVWDDTVEERYQTPGVPITRDGISISVNCKDPVRAIQFIDWMLEEDQQKLFTWGEEGVDYTVNEEGRFYRTDEQREKLKTEEYRLKRGIGAFSYPWPTNANVATYEDGNSWNPTGQPEEITAGYTDADKKVLEAYGVETYGQMFNETTGNPWGEAWDIKPEDGSDVQITLAKAEELTKTYVPKLILADAGKYQAIWDEYKAEYEKLDIAAVEEFFTTKVKERVEAWK
ncbi:ABC transporter substrate-binding protein [Clostridium grantii]|uniref:Putative aldouronate transport system substrate-binding protein n=1 Tax=Clostridium grantii DSM 8605 TaxID=1121316 RepID=A0A1M5VV82_9CLOT|nr:ABC transporter substrate-binding protein [Clostridium grantii]SHH79209.1 putative aldouronate transport system substrate-binding protein [Clostridium grantii DSM 8605]